MRRKTRIAYSVTAMGVATAGAVGAMSALPHPAGHPAGHLVARERAGSAAPTQLAGLDARAAAEIAALQNQISHARRAIDERMGAGNQVGQGNTAGPGSGSSASTSSSSPSASTGRSPYAAPTPPASSRPAAPSTHATTGASGSPSPTGGDDGGHDG